jgi:hypothetical protein
MRRHTGEKKYRTSLEEEIECSETPPALLLRNVVQMCWLFNIGHSNAICRSTPSTRFPSQFSIGQVERKENAAVIAEFAMLQFQQK